MNEAQFADWLRSQRTLSQREVDERERVHDRDNWTSQERLAH